MIGLDFTAMDARLIQYTAMFAHRVQPEVIYFVHVAKPLNVPKAIQAIYGDHLTNHIDEAHLEKIQQLIDQHFDETLRKRVSIEMPKGDIKETLLKLFKKKHVDLFIMGNKRDQIGASIFSMILTKISCCSILLIPENGSQAIKKIMVPIDFSEASKLAVETAQNLSKQNNASLVCQHVYQVPTGYHTTGKSFEEFAKIMKENAEKESQNFLKHIQNETLECELTLGAHHHNPADKIYEFALQTHADMVIMGSKGKTIAAALLLGSVTDRLIHHKNPMPTLIVKKHNLDFLHALLVRS